MGVWCPHCGNRHSIKVDKSGCAFGLALVLTLGLALIWLPFLPKAWRCLACGHEWRA